MKIILIISDFYFYNIIELHKCEYKMFITLNYIKNEIPIIFSSNPNNMQVKKMWFNMKYAFQ